MQPKNNTAKATAARTIRISIADPRPLLTEGKYIAQCADATCAWSRRWKKWIVRLVMQPLDYFGQPFQGELCKFLALGTNPHMPHAGAHSGFRRLWVEVNGAQPLGNEVDLTVFVGHHFRISVQSVKAKADKEHTPIDQAHWYSIVREVSFCKPGSLTLEHQQHANTNNTSNTTHLQHSQHPNTANTDNTTNRLTLDNTSTLKQTQQHPNTSTLRVPSEADHAPVADFDFDFGEYDSTPSTRQGAEPRPRVTAPDSHKRPGKKRH